MNNLPSQLNLSEVQKTENLSSMMHFGKFPVHHWVAVAALVSLTVILFALFSYLGVTYQVTQHSTGLSGRKMKEPVFASDKRSIWIIVGEASGIDQ